MLKLLAPGLFWSDIALGIAALACAQAMRRRGYIASLIFTLAGASSWLGAVHHGLIGTTATSAGKWFWVLTLTTFVGSSVAIMQYAFNRRFALIPLGALLLVYALLAFFISDDFIWASAVQGAADIVYGITLWRRTEVVPRRTSDESIVWYGWYVVTTALAAFVATRTSLPITHLMPLTVFHLIEIAAVIMLYQSIKTNREREADQVVFKRKLV